MKAKFFNSLDSIDWTRLWWIAAIVTAFWSAMGAITIIYPVLDKPYKVVAIFVSAITAALLVAVRGTKYVKDRTELPPQDGKV